MFLYVIFQKFGHFSYFCLLVTKKFLTKKWFFFFFFLPFSQIIIIFSKIWYKKWILWLISIPEMYTFINITVIVWKLQHSICFKKFWVHTPLMPVSNKDLKTIDLTCLFISSDTVWRQEVLWAWLSCSVCTMLWQMWWVAYYSFLIV